MPVADQLEVDLSLVDILIVEDEAHWANPLMEALRDAGASVQRAKNSETAIRLLTSNQFDVVLLDLDLGSRSTRDGFDVLRHSRDVYGTENISALRRQPLFIITTTYDSFEDAVEALQLGAVDYVRKVAESADNTAKVVLSKVADRVNTHLQLVALRAYRQDRELQSMIGQSEAFEAALDRLRRAAPKDVFVHIHGETGTGKELFAQAVHRESHRADEPFVAINCAAISGELLESELFGHTKGAFTTALAEKPGLFEIADKGTLFIDEIGDMPEPMQSKLLRILEDGIVRRVGSVKESRVDVRILSATNRNLEQDIAAGRFRLDLFYRIAPLIIELPPLRDRGDDIAVLADYFLRIANGKHETHVRSITAEAMQLLNCYSWPGNVRQLKNVIVDWAVVLDSDGIIDVDDLPPSVTESELTQSVSQDKTSHSSASGEEDAVGLLKGWLDDPSSLATDRVVTLVRIAASTSDGRAVRMPRNARHKSIVADAVRQLLPEFGDTKQKLANVLGISSPTLRKWLGERGETTQ